jgi:L-ascorbate metabolism protein UlaG (beta-lactamase superfamily)
MNITFYGHQSWGAENRGRTILFDPLLRPYFGASTHSFCAISPFREVLPLEGIVAIFLSHEHADHFCLETLGDIARRYSSAPPPVYTGTLMPAHVDEGIRRLGLPLVKFADGEDCRVADALTVTPYHGDPDTPFWERRVYQFDVHGDDGEFFLAVDAGMSPSTVARLQQAHGAPPALFAVSNNSQVAGLQRRAAMQNDDLSPSHDPAKNGLVGLAVYAGLLAGYAPGLSASHTAVCGGGFVKGMADLEPDPLADFRPPVAAIGRFANAAVSAPWPGDTYVIEGNRVRAIVRSPSVRLLDRQAFASRYLPSVVSTAFGYRPLVDGRRDHDPAELIAAAGLALRFFALSEQGLAFWRACLETGVPPTVRMLVDGLAAIDGECTGVELDLRSGAARRSTWRESDPSATCTLRIHASDFAALLDGGIDIWELSGSHLSHRHPPSMPNFMVPFLYSYFGEQVDQAVARRFVDARLSALTP